MATGYTFLYVNKQLSIQDLSLFEIAFSFATKIKTDNQLRLFRI